MALDPNIALAVRVAPFETRIQSPVDRYARMLSLRQLMQQQETSQALEEQRRQTAELARKKAEGQAQFQGLWEEGKPRPTEAQAYRYLDPTAAAAYAQTEQARVTTQQAQEAARIKNEQARDAMLGQIAGGVLNANTQEGFERGIMDAGARDLISQEELHQLIGLRWDDPQTKAQVAQIARRGSEIEKQQAMDIAAKQEGRAAALGAPQLTEAQIKAEQAQAEQDAGMLAAAASRSQEEFQTKLAALPPDRAARFQGATTPLDIYKRGQTPAQRITSEQAATTAAATDRYRQEQLGISRGQLGVAQEGLGLRREDLELRRQTQTGKPSTGEEKKALAYHLRAQQAEDTLTTLEDHMNKMGLFGQAWQKFGPEFIQSEENKALFQAQRAFTEARLRKESGAAIPPHEFENDKRTYFPQPGDSPERLKQKARGRAAVIRGLAVGAGRAHTEYYGTPPPTAADPLQTGGEKKAGEGAPAVGTVKGGYKFTGGDPADKNNWRKVT